MRDDGGGVGSLGGLHTQLLSIMAVLGTSKLSRIAGSLPINASLCAKSDVITQLTAVGTCRHMPAPRNDDLGSDGAIPVRYGACRSIQTSVGYRRDGHGASVACIAESGELQPEAMRMTNHKR